jgi:C-terminal, D2-small domain, of ClpB protein
MQRGVRGNLDERLKALCIRTFSAELYNRFDKVVVFRPLSQPAIEKIVEKHLKYLQKSLAQRKFDITWDQSVVVHLSAISMDVTMGARDIHRKIKEHVLSKLTASRIEGKILETDAKVHMKVVDSQLELVILDKGKVAVKPLHEQGTEAKEALNVKEAIILKDGVVYLDLANQRPLQELQGKYVFRLSAKGNDRSYNEGIKIVEVSSIGEILYEDNDLLLNKKGEIRFLSSEWDDGKWAPVTPAKNGKGFFENICTLIDPSSQEQALSLVKNIFSSLGKDCHLSTKAPFTSLREYCIKGKKEDLLREIDILEELTGPLQVAILSNGSNRGDSNGPFHANL